MDDLTFVESPRFLNILQSGTGKNACAVSRREILEWVNEWFDKDYKRLEQLKTGVEYCCLLNELIPQCVAMNKVRMDTLSDYDCTENWYLIYTCLNTHGVAKELAIDRLASGGSRESLDFAQWFKTFFDRNTEYILQKANQKSKDQPTPTTKKIGEGRDSLYLVEPVVRSATQPNMRYAKAEDARAGGPSKQTRNANGRRMHSVSPSKTAQQKSLAKDAKKRPRAGGRGGNAEEGFPQKKTLIVKRLLREAQQKLALEQSACADVEVDEEEEEEAVVEEAPPKKTPTPKKRLRFAEKKTVRERRPSEDEEEDEQVVDVPPKRAPIPKKRLRAAQKKTVPERSPSQDVEVEEEVPQKKTHALKKRLREAHKKPVPEQSPSQDVEVEEETPQKKTPVQKKRLRNALKKTVREQSPSQDVELEEEVVEVPQKKTQIQKKRLREAHKKTVPERSPIQDVEVEEEAVEVEVPRVQKRRMRVAKKKVPERSPSEEVDVEEEVKVAPKKRIVRKRTKVPRPSEDLEVEGDVNVAPKKTRNVRKRVRVHSLSPDSPKQNGPAEEKTLPGVESAGEAKQVEVPPKKSRVQRKRMRVHSLSPDNSQKQNGPAEEKTLPVPSPSLAAEVEEVGEVEVPRETRIPQRRRHSMSPMRSKVQGPSEHIDVNEDVKVEVPTRIRMPTKFRVHSLSPIRSKQTAASPERTQPVPSPSVDVPEVKAKLPPKKTRIPKRRPNQSISPTRVAGQNTLDDVVVGVPSLTKEPSPEASPRVDEDSHVEVILPPRHLRTSKNQRVPSYSDSSNSSSSTLAPQCSRKDVEMEGCASTKTLCNGGNQEMIPFEMDDPSRLKDHRFSMTIFDEENGYDQSKRCTETCMFLFQPPYPSTP